MRRRQSDFMRAIACLCLAGAAASACADEAVGPELARTAAEAQALLRSISGFATLSGMLDDAGWPASTSPELAEAESLWVRAGEADPAAAVRMRAAAARMAAPELAHAVGPADWARVRAAQRGWLEAASIMLEPLDVPAADAALVAAAERIAEAEAAAAEGLAEAAALSTLLAAARLAETTPAALSGRLTAEAESRLAAWSSSEEDGAGDRMRRVERLVDGARAAYDEGEYLLSARRANYALQMMEAR